MTAHASNRRMLRLLPGLAAGLLAACLGFLPAAALAQDEDVPQEPRAAPAAQAKAAPGDASDSVAKRLGRLEQQMHDLQAMVAALESLVKAKPEAVLPQESAQGQGPGAGAEGDLGARVEALETQIGALTSGLEQLQARLSGGAQPLPPPPPDGAPPGRQGAASPPPDPALAAAGGGGAPSFESTISAAGEDGTPPAEEAPQDGAGDESLPPLNADRSPAADDQPQSLAALPASDATSLYNEGYGSLLRQDYGAAATAFAKLVAAYPTDPLAGKAQYWLGETYYVRGQYKSAAEAFLKGYKQFKGSEKAPDSLLKLGMALAALGQKKEACSAFGELGAKFPAAPDYVHDQAKEERRKAGC